MLTGIGNLIFALCFGFSILIVVKYFFGSPRKTTLYRKEMVDLYVAGRIKQFAKEDNIDLDAEYESFKKWRKKREMESYINDVVELDDVVEGELKDKITEEHKSKK